MATLKRYFKPIEEKTEQELNNMRSESEEMGRLGARVYSALTKAMLEGVKQTVNLQDLQVDIEEGRGRVAFKFLDRRHRFELKKLALQA